MQDLNEKLIANLKHRLAMVQDDLDQIIEFIHRNGLTVTFAQPTDCCDECWTHFYNISIACDLSSDESLEWRKFNSTKTATDGTK